MRFLQLDPRQTPEALATNNEILNAGQVLGIEVTVPKLAARCDLGNVDPQHTGGRSDTAAIEVAAVGAVDYRVYCDHDGGPRPSEWGTVTLVTVRPDLDSVGAMAALSLLAQGKDLSSARGRIAAIAEFDKFANGEWPGKRPLPTAENPWPEKGARKLAAIAASAEDFRKPLGERVAEMERWLLSGDEPEGYRPRVEAERVEMIHALENGDIKVAEVDDGRIAVVKSTHRAATMLGYMRAPVVIALNPEFRFQGGTPHKKFTVCQFLAGYVDLPEVVNAISDLEPGWGGSPTIVGSPQGMRSTLTVDQVVNFVSAWLVAR